MLALEWGEHCEMTKVLWKKNFSLLVAWYGSLCKSRARNSFFFSSSFWRVFLLARCRRNTKATREEAKKKRGKGKQINKQVDGRRNLCDKKICLIYFFVAFCRSFVSFCLFFGAEDSFREVTYAKFRVVRIMAFCEIGVHKVAALRCIRATLCARGSMVMIIADD